MVVQSLPDRRSAAAVAPAFFNALRRQSTLVFCWRHRSGIEIAGDDFEHVVCNFHLKVDVEYPPSALSTILNENHIATAAGAALAGNAPLAAREMPLSELPAVTASFNWRSVRWYGLDDDQALLSLPSSSMRRCANGECQRNGTDIEAAARNEVEALLVERFCTSQAMATSARCT